MTTSTRSGLDLRVGRPRRPPPGRPVRPRQRPLAARRTRSPRTARRTARSARCTTAPRSEVRDDRRGGAAAAARRRTRGEGRRPLRLVHGHRRASRPLGVAPLRPLLDEVVDAATTQAELTGGAGRAAAHRGRAALFGVLRRHRRQGLHPLPRAPAPGRPRACRTSRTTATTQYARDPRRLRRAPRPAGRAGRACAEPATRSPSRVMDLETALAAGIWDRVTNRDAEKTYNAMTLAALRRARPRLRLGRLARRRSARRPARSTRSSCAQPSFVDGAARLWAERPLEQWKAWLGDPHRLRVRRLPDRRARRGGLRLLRPHADRHPGAARALEARRLAGRGRARRGRRQALRRAALPAGRQGADGHARRATWSRPTAQSISHAGLDGPGDPRAGAGQARRVHPEDRLPGPLEGLLDARGPARRPARQRAPRRRVATPTASWPRSASRSTATSGS